MERLTPAGRAARRLVDAAVSLREARDRDCATLDEKVDRITRFERAALTVVTEDSVADDETPERLEATVRVLLDGVERLKRARAEARRLVRRLCEGHCDLERDRMVRLNAAAADGRRAIARWDTEADDDGGAGE